METYSCVKSKECGILIFIKIIPAETYNCAKLHRNAAIIEERLTAVESYKVVHFFSQGQKLISSDAELCKKMLKWYWYFCKEDNSIPERNAFQKMFQPINRGK